MNAQEEQLLVQVAAQVAPVVIELVIAVLRDIAKWIAQPTDQAEIIIIAGLIVAGIEQDHPDWPPEERRRYAADAIATAAMHRSIVLPTPTVNQLVEASLIQLRGTA